MRKLNICLLLIMLILALTSCDLDNNNQITPPPTSEETLDSSSNRILLAINNAINNPNGTTVIDNQDGSYTVTDFEYNGVNITGEITVDEEGNITSANLSETGIDNQEGPVFSISINDNGTASITINGETSEVSGSLIPRKATEKESNLINNVSNSFGHSVSDGMNRILIAMAEAITTEPINGSICRVNNYTYNGTSLTGTINVSNNAITGCDIQYEITAKNPDGSNYTQKGTLIATLTDGSLAPSEVSLEINNYQSNDNSGIVIKSGTFYNSSETMQQRLEATFNLNGSHTYSRIIDFKNQIVEQTLDGQKLIADLWYDSPSPPVVEVPPIDIQSALTSFLMTLNPEEVMEFSISGNTATITMSIPNANYIYEENGETIEIISISSTSEIKYDQTLPPDAGWGDLSDSDNTVVSINATTNISIVYKENICNCTITVKDGNTEFYWH